MAKIIGIDNDSVLTGAVKVGDEAIAFNGRKFIDAIDYAYIDSMEEGILTISRDGIIKDIPFKKDCDESLGLEFDKSVEITPIECCNNCVFCFVSQLPKGLRDTLYIKDDDYRLSFISGSYITCTNLNEGDIERILDYKLSPLYVSVHATDENVRNFMLGIKKSRPIMPLLKRFIAAGIVIHAQIVLIGGINDGEVLKNSLVELHDAGVRTVAVVPVGLTGHRSGLYEIEPLTKEQATAAIELTESLHEKYCGFCYCADEMYQIAGKNVKEPEYYGNYEQIENGVGMIAKFLEEVDIALGKRIFRPLFRKKIAVITGISGASVMNEAKTRIEKRYPKISVEVIPIKNEFFGESVTVTGLVTATDIIKQCGDLKKFDYVMIPSVMLKEFGDVFLDNMSVKELEKTLNKKIITSHTDGESFVDCVLKGGKR